MAIPNAEIQAAARQMKSAQDQALQIEPFTSRQGGFDIDTGYAVGHIVHQARLAEGAVAVGRKIGFTNPAMWAQYGVRQPVWAHVYHHTVHQLPDQGARCSLGQFVEPKIEPEIVLHFGSTPPAGGDVLALLHCVDWVAHAFEIVQSHFPGWKFQAADTVADAALHATLLVGAPVPVDQLGPDPLAALEGFSLTLSCDGSLRETGKGSNVLGNPVAAVAHLLAVLAGQPQAQPLQAGEMVTTGTLTSAFPVRAGQTWQTTLAGLPLPGLRVAFD